MFTVKATYRSEIRKFTFQDSSFPTFSQINDQLSRVLPISTSYYLARLLFVQSQSAPFARILIGMEAHSEEEYEQHVRPFRGREWPGGLLRFTVYDEDSPNEISSNVSTQQDDQDILMEDSYGLDGGHRRPHRHEHRHGHGHGHHHSHHHGHHRGHHRRGDLPPWARPSFVAPPPPPLPPPPPPPPLPPPPFFPFFHVPSPPPPPSHHGSPLIVPPLPILSPHVAHPAPPLPSLPPIQPLSQNYAQQQSPTPTVDDSETPVQRLFRRRGLRSVASAPLLAPSLPVPPPPPPPPPPRPVSLYGEVQIVDSPAMRPVRRAATVSGEVDEFEVQALAEQVADIGRQRDPCCDMERGKQEISNIIRTFKTDIDRVLSQSLHMEPTEVWGFLSTERQPMSPTPASPSNSERTVETNQSQPPEPTHAAEAPSDAEPVIHANVLCDSCQEVIIGVRNKCLDCPDFDLCSSCLATQPQSIGLHSRSHSLFAIEEPGGVWVHTVFTGEGTTDVPEPPVTNGGPVEPPKTTPEIQRESTPVAEVALPVHHASCDLCDSTIKGDRYKCLDCPDFDTCASCYTIVPIQHPRHGFARLHDPQDLKYPSSSSPFHGARCNECGKMIYGVRYKCMHPACTDFDLCASCEALPIPVHPITHAMLKIREPGAYIPLVKRYDIQRVLTPVASVHDLHKSHEDDIAQSTEGQAHIRTDIDVVTMPGQYAPVESDALPTPIPSIAHLSGVSTKPTVELVDVSYPDFENDMYESTKKPVPFAFGAPVVVRDSANPSQPGHHVPTTAPLLPVPSPPPALATDFIRAVPSLHQNSQYTQDLITGLHGSDTRSAPWWGQSAWVPPTPPAPLPVPLRTPFTPRRSQSPELLVHFEEQHDTVQASADTLPATTTLLPESDSGHTPDSLPHVPPMDFNELFDLTSQFRHLLELPPVPTPLSMLTPPQEMYTRSRTGSTAADEVSAPTELASTQVDNAETPLSLVALLSKPEKAPRPGALDGISPGRLLSQLLDSSSLSSPVSKNAYVDEDVPLRASFIADNNIPDGQIFPPGAEFVKSWRMRNDGPGSWPADTELVFVAGDKLVIDKSERFKVGGVPPGEEVDVWTGEMKAPDIPGKYISYWRLCDEKGRRFGHSIWVDISVTEPAKAPTSEESDGSLASSSVVMPHSAPSNPSVPIPSHDESTTAPFPSDASSVSLIDVLSDDEDEDSEVYEDSRSHFGSTPGNGQVLSPDVEYVVLSDGSDEL